MANQHGKESGKCGVEHRFRLWTEEGFNRIEVSEKKVVREQAGRVKISVFPRKSTVFIRLESREAQ